MFICKKEEEEKEKEGNIMLHPKLPSHVSQADWTLPLRARATEKLGNLDPAPTEPRRFVVPRHPTSPHLTSVNLIAPERSKAQTLAELAKFVYQRRVVQRSILLNNKNASNTQKSRSTNNIEERRKGDRVMEVKNPRRVLAVSLADSTQHLSRVIKDLTGTHPEPASTTLAGTTHILPIKTSYYTADVPIWLDLIDSPAEWSASFLSPEAKEVLTVLGGLAVVFALPSSPSSSSSTSAPLPADGTTPAPASVTAPATTPQPSPEDTRALITEVGRVVREGLGGWGWDGVGLGIGVGDGTADEWEDLCAEWGLEFVQVRGGKKDDGRNEFGGSSHPLSCLFFSVPALGSLSCFGSFSLRSVHADIPLPEKMGIARVLEALESNDWDAADDMDGPSDLDSDLDTAAGDLPRKPRPLAGGTSNDDDGDDNDDFDLDDPENLDFGFDRADFEGLKKAIWNLEQEPEDEDEVVEGGAADTAKAASGSAGGAATTEKPDSAKTTQEKKAEDAEKEDLNAEDVEKIEQMMRKLQAVRDLSAGLPEDQRRRMAKKAVGEVMKEL
ncbi:alpha and gamma adaptin binding protein p34 [Colletotrichum paranaense]|uniref:Alpha and gamma adaptin binding protein p34 n=1 Tax=Colletotrichum paranaense TaxID=1914294 RepID=A0ABQ9SJF6_9PEZI|nr:alpha and gamma adaptin binding protein p34 [Colletotrichum paranaense]KAK1538028.1 alpha and gamma adaptin binding protein p34 [Colletotrichum paranaense]